MITRYLIEGTKATITLAAEVFEGKRSIRIHAKAPNPRGSGYIYATTVASRPGWFARRRGATMDSSVRDAVERTLNRLSEKALLERKLDEVEKNISEVHE